MTFLFSLLRGYQPDSLRAQASKFHLELHDRGLEGITGAQHIISMLESNHTIRTVVLGHNPLGDEGTAILFDFLSSSWARRNIYLDSITINSCQIGNLGLGSIARYLDGNRSLRSLFLQNNQFNPSWNLTSALTSALNHSVLEVLSLNNNPQLSDTFLFRFLPNLSAPHLRELHLSAVGLTPISTPYIVNFLANNGPEHVTPVTGYQMSLGRKFTKIASRRLSDLRLNGNTLTLSCAQAVVQVLKTSNFSIHHFEMFANNFSADIPARHPLAGTIPPKSAASSSGEISEMAWPDLKAQMSAIFTRNRVLTSMATISALHLLSPSRTLLLPTLNPKNKSPWCLLPTEIQLQVLSVLGLGLSPQQLIRIWTYASDRTTLPDLYQPLPSLFDRTTTVKTRDQLREEWLCAVGCDRFEWYAGWEEDLDRLVSD
ncbi:hypothetical protein FRC04_010215 [Tulasnella sp. 424]|nr:hypothetical protein FRC04_010215 [Tulasnella sp. 424]KAG8966413.1 hypothetical protein FRC05_002659 [Tulasnella sp. 425]